MVVGQAREELLEALRLPQDHVNPASPAFTVTLVLGGPEADPLIALKNSDQASRITVEPGNTGIRLIGLQPSRLYYAVKTLQQLVIPYATHTSVTIPLPQMREWPDMADRGVWGCDHFACPSISHIGHTQPFQSAESVNYRMNEFVSKNFSGIIGYATPAVARGIPYPLGARRR